MNLLTPPAASPAAVTSFVALVGAVAVVGVASVRVASINDGADARTTRRRTIVAALVLLAWLAATYLAGASGVLGEFDRRPPPVLVLGVTSFVLSTALALSPAGALLARALPISVLVGFQAFRLPLELILYRLSLDGVLPVQMTFDGMNFDIVSGVLAGVLGLWASWRPVPRILLRAWNLLALVLLAAIVTIAILSTPLPIRVFPNEPANRIVATVPFVWLPSVLVQAAWIGHVLMFRRLAQKR